MSEDTGDLKGKRDKGFQSRLSPKFPTAKQVIILEPRGNKKGRGSGRKRKRGTSYYENVKQRAVALEQQHDVDRTSEQPPKNNDTDSSNDRDKNLWMYYSNHDTSRVEEQDSSRENSVSDYNRYIYADSRRITTDENENLLRRRNKRSSSCLMCGLGNVFGIPSSQVAILEFSIFFQPKHFLCT